MKLNSGFVLWVLWFVVWIGLALFFRHQSNIPLYKTVTVDIHNPVSWLSDWELIGEDGITLYAKSYTNNHAIYDSSENLVATGTPVEMDPGESKQPFESSFKTQTDVRYDREGYVNLYALEPTEITFEVDRFGYPLLTIICYVVLLFSFFGAVGIVQ